MIEPLPAPDELTAALAEHEAAADDLRAMRVHWWMTCREWRIEHPDACPSWRLGAVPVEPEALRPVHDDLVAAERRDDAARERLAAAIRADAERLNSIPPARGPAL